MARTAAAEIAIGWIGPLTGNAAILGVDTVPAIELALEEINSAGGINGEKLVLYAEDDQYITAKTVTAYNTLVHQRGARIIFVLTYGGLSVLAPRAQRDGVILLDTLDADEDTARLPSNTFCIAKTTESLGVGVASQILAHNDFPLAVLYFDGDPFMGTLAKSLIAELDRNGKRPEIVETYNDTTTDFRSLATRIISRKIKGVALLGYDQLGLAARTLKDLGNTAQLYGVNTATSPGFRKIAGDSVENMRGVVFVAPRTEALRRFEERFISRVGRSWQFESSTLPSYDTMQLISKALSESGSVTATISKTPVVHIDKIREWLLSVKDYPGISGTITIDPDGITRSLTVFPGIFSGGRFIKSEALSKP
jgi:branched-chain amino acid transport system substrate-binding protein